MNANGKNLQLSPRKPVGIVDQNGVETQKSLFMASDLEDLASISVYVMENSAAAGRPEDGQAVAATLQGLMSRIITLLPPWQLAKLPDLMKP